LLTAFDVLFILALGDPLRGRPVKMFEYLIAALVSCAAYLNCTMTQEWHLGALGFDLHSDHYHQSRC